MTFDLLDNLARSGTNHDHDQPSHLVVKTEKQDKPQISLKRYSAPEERYIFFVKKDSVQLKFMNSYKILKMEVRSFRSMLKIVSIARHVQSR